QACNHCHVESSPKRMETMDERVADRCLDPILPSSVPPSPSFPHRPFPHTLSYLRLFPIETLDLTGGAPELSGQFRRLVAGGRAAGAEVIDRCNLTVLLEPGQEDLAEFLADNKVRRVVLKQERRYFLAFLLNAVHWKGKCASWRLCRATQPRTSTHSAAAASSIGASRHCGGSTSSATARAAMETPTCSSTSFTTPSERFCRRLR
ncbi:unnamed protein product, partial [Phaeothamnion confervicola]